MVSHLFTCNFVESFFLLMCLLTEYQGVLGYLVYIVYIQYVQITFVIVCFNIV